MYDTPEERHAQRVRAAHASHTADAEFKRFFRRITQLPPEEVAETARSLPPGYQAILRALLPGDQADSS